MPIILQQKDILVFRNCSQLKKLFLVTLVIKIIGVYFVADFSAAFAKFDEKRMLITNIAIPVGIAALRAHYEGTSIKKAVIQAVFGGYIMNEGLKGAAKLQEKSSWYAWENKLLFNLGASLCESAGYEKFTFRMDVGPVWIIHEDNKLKFKLGINGIVSPLIHIIEGSKFDYKQSLKYGTMVFERNTDKSGHLIGTDALAYSTANTFTTNHDGEHSGHELVHTYQYRRNAIYPIQISDFYPEFTTKYFKDDKWVDDTGWFVNWGLQCGWADWRDKNRSFDIPLEEEAYYMERKYRRKF